MTKREMFTLIATVNSDNAEIVDFCNHEIELIDKKVTHKTPTKTQKENEALIDVLENVLAELDAPATVTELIVSNDTLSSLSNQKVSALLRKMVESGRAIKTVEKKKAYFFHI